MIIDSLFLLSFGLKVSNRFIRYIHSVRLLFLNDHLKLICVTQLHEIDLSAHLYKYIHSPRQYCQWRIYIEKIRTHAPRSNIFTARKRSFRRLCFYRCLSVHRWGVSASVHAGMPYAPGGRQPSGGRHPLEADTHPRSRNPPWKQIPPRSRHPLPRKQAPIQKNRYPPKK